MTLKTAFIATGVWTVVGLVLSVVLVIAIASGSTRRSEANQRASMAGSGAGLVMAIGYGAIWLPYAAAMGKRRRAEREHTKEAKQKRDD